MLEETALRPGAVHAWLAGALLLAGCGVHMPDPRVSSVEPDRGWTGEDTVVTIRGMGFYPQIELNAGRSGSVDLDEGFGAWLEDRGSGERFNLGGVSALDPETLQGIVVAGVPPGTYDLRVQGPTGRTGALRDAFTVSITRADRVVVDAASLIWEVHEVIPVDLYLIDPHGERVLTDAEVKLTVTGEDDLPAPVTFRSSSLDAARSEADALIGSLGGDGFATVRLSVAQPGTWTVTATPTNDRSGVDASSIKLLVEPGSQLALDVRLPGPDFVAEAGEAFPVELELRDQHGNPVPDKAATVVLRDVCNTWIDVVLISGVTTVPVRLERATHDGCPHNAIFTDPASTVLGRSADFTVAPGPVRSFQVGVVPTPVVAGELLLTQVVPIDAFANPAVWTGSLTLTDSVGGLGPPTCSGTVGHTTVCFAQVTVAGEEVVLQVDDGQGITGESRPYSVLPSSVVDGVEVQVPGPFEAGEPTRVEVVLRDPWGNVIDAGGLGPGSVTLTDERGEGTCVLTAPGRNGAARADCVLYQARPDAILTATAAGISGSSPPFAVHNGPLTSVTLTASGPVTAGAGFPLSVAGFDAWGNPYLTQGDPVVILRDTSGTLSLPSVDLGPAGVITESASVTRAGTTVIEAWQGGELLGTSAPLLVQPASSSALRVSVGAPWAWTGQPVEVRVESVDGWGNRTDLGGPLTLESRETQATLSATLVNGVATVPFTWTEPALDDVLEARTDGGLEGASSALHVVQDCEDGPTASLTFAGWPEAVACADPLTGAGAIAGSFSGSQGSAPLIRHVLAVRGGPRAEAQGSTVLLELPGIGIHALSGLVVQSDLCADEIATHGFVGPDDGQPVGPLAIRPEDGTISAGFGETTVHIEDVTDCARDVAAHATVKLRTTLGTLDGLAPSGSGLAITLDPQGRAEVVLDAATVPTAGAAWLHAWVDSGAAAGLASVDIDQDLQLPVVWEQQPSGELLDPVSEVRLVFSEPLRTVGVGPEVFSVDGPASVSVVDVRFEADDREIVLTLDPPADGALGIWTVTASDALRDRAGNRLDGGWIGARSPWEGVFGLVFPSVHPVTCGPPSPEAVLRPDGDDGPGAEADQVIVEVSTPIAPTWWVMSVRRQATGALHRRDFLVPGGATGPIVWDGRDGAGRIVANGTWLIEIEPLDGLGNRGEGCSVAVTVDNRRGVLP